MIKIDIFKNAQKLICAYRVKGHAEFNPEGFDPVCALVSVITQTPIMGLEQHLKHELSYIVDEEDGILEVTLKKAPNELTQAILATMLYGLKGLAENYPEYIRIQEHRR